VHRAIQQGLVLSAHDCSEGGLAVAAAEMAIAGKLGVRIDLESTLVSDDLRGARPERVMFSESQSRILLEVPADKIADLKACMKDAPFSIVGEVTGDADVRFARGESRLATVSIAALERAWKTPLDLDGTLCKEIAQ
jgi:phosphoribosylformylglycinamidine synthase